MNTQMRGPNAGRGRPVLPVARALAEQTFRLADIPAVRRAAAAFGARAGMGRAKLSDFVQAVSEAAACAVAQGPCTARLRLWTTENRAFCEVRGDGMLLADGPRGARLGDAERASPLAAAAPVRPRVRGVRTAGRARVAVDDSRLTRPSLFWSGDCHRARPSLLVG